MGFQRWRRLAWCVLFTFVAVGPHLLGANGEFDELPVSGAYGFIAFGLLLGLWATSYPEIATLFRMRKTQALCAIASLALVCFVDFLGGFRHAYAQVLENGTFNALFMSDSGMAHGWVLDLLAFAGGVAPYESLLLFLGAFCCAASAAVGGASRPSPRGAASAALGYGMALLPCILAGILRVQTWTVLCEAPVSFLFLWAGVFAWSLSMARFAGQRACIAAICLGELLFRLMGRLGLVAPLQAVGSWAPCLSVLCLAGCCLACRRLEHVRDSGSREVDGSDAQRPLPCDGMLFWEKEAVRTAGLTQREIDVLGASLDGRSSKDAADVLGMQPSTVRSYKGRICKKLGLDSFDQVLVARARHQGVFRIPDAASDSRTPGSDSDSPQRHPRIGAGLRLLGCLGLLVLVLMPSGCFARYWDATWLMAYGCAAGAMLSCVPGVLGHLGAKVRAAQTGVRGRTIVVPLLFTVFGIACLASRLLVEFFGMGLGTCQELALVVCAAGFVCFGMIELRFCIASACLDSTEFGIPCACVVVALNVALLSGIAWFLLAAALFACYMVGFALSSKRRVEMDVPVGPASALSWFTVAFVWEECWRGVAYSSMQDVGIVCLSCLVLFSLRVLHDSANAPHSAVVLTTLVGLVLTCVEAGTPFGLVVGVAIFEVQSLHARSLAQAGLEGAQEGAPALPSLLGLAAGCCVAVYVANARGSYILFHGDSILPGNLDWASLACFGASLAIVILRALFDPAPALPDSPRIGRARLEGYLVGKGLSDVEVSVCVALAQGESVAQAAEALHYSTSHAGAIKRAAFATLDVRTRRQFLSLLWREFNQAQGSHS